jgi:CRP/FNR family transcriptional regulator
MPFSYQQEEIKKILRAYYPQLSQEQLIEEIAEYGELVHKPSGTVIMDFGSYVKTMPLLYQGSLKILRMNDRGEEIFLYYLSPGDTCASAFSCCMMQKKSLLKTEAEEDVSFIGVPLKYADLWMSKYPIWRNFIVQNYDKRLMELIETIDTIAFSKMDERLLDYLQKKSEVLNTRQIQTTHQEIANDINASREAVSRLLKKMEKDQIVKLGRNIVELL